MKLGEARLRRIKDHFHEEEWYRTKSTLQCAMTLNNKTHQGRKRKGTPRTAGDPRFRLRQR